jgi:hypothetical protein
MSSVPPLPVPPNTQQASLNALLAKYPQLLSDKDRSLPDAQRAKLIKEAISRLSEQGIRKQQLYPQQGQGQGQQGQSQLQPALPIQQNSKANKQRVAANTTPQMAASQIPTQMNVQVNGLSQAQIAQMAQMNQHIPQNSQMNQVPHQMNQQIPVHPSNIPQQANTQVRYVSWYPAD